MQRQSDNYWWGGWSDQRFKNSAVPIFSSAAITNVYVSSVAWSYAFSPSKLDDTTQYYVMSRAVDGAVNYEVMWATNSFTYDITPPVSKVVLPDNDPTHSIHDPYSSMVLISGTASDGLGQIKTVKIMLYAPSQAALHANNAYWTRASGVAGVGTDWSSTPTLLDASYNSGTGKWTYDSSGVAWDAQNTPGFEYHVWTQVQDQANNYETAPSTNVFWYAAPLPNTWITFPGEDKFRAGILHFLE
jgi:hypothetical protein